MFPFPLPRAMDLWLPAWLRHSSEGPVPLGGRHLLLAVCDHFEPYHQGVSQAEALSRMRLWSEGLDGLGEFRDSTGQAPRHTFFYPIEQYEAEVVTRLAALCHGQPHEAEVHLHHENDTAASLREKLLLGRDRLAGHGLLSRDRAGAVRYGFIHGNWALDHSHPQGHACGVSNELSILTETGCYADFTLPSAPNRTQTRTINSLYYARCTPEPKSHDSGRRVVADRDVIAPRPDELLIVQGPLALNWTNAKWGLIPRVENSDLTAKNPPTPERLRLWLDCRVTVAGRPSWLFVKLHTHGAKPDNARMLLGEPMKAFHRHLRRLKEQDPAFHYHYVSAREMVNILHAAEAGHSGNPAAFRDYRYRRTGQPDAVPVS